MLFNRWILVCVICIPFSVQAQSKKQTLNEFFKSQPNKNDLGFGEGLLFRADTVNSNGEGGTIAKYFPSGNKYEEASFINFKKSELHGRETRWFENGQIQAQEDYTNGKRDGALITYYSNGSVRRREEHQDNKLVKGECFTPDGKPTAYFDYFDFPEFPGGLVALLTKIQSSTKYPKEALKRGYEGKVLVNFIVDKTGKVKETRVIQSVSPLLDQEALRVVNSLKGWTPGKLDGEVADILFTLPVTFKVQ